MSRAETAEAIDDRLAGLLRDGAAAYPDMAEEDWPLLLERIHYHGVAGRLSGRAGWPGPVAADLRREALGRAMWELRHRQLVAALVEALDAAGIPALLLKGTALAYSVHDEPAERTRGDTDLWVPPGELAGARAILAAQGFRCIGDPSTPASMQLQESWEQSPAPGQTHAIDLHWSAINSLALKDLFLFEDCWSRRQPLPRLGAGAFGLSDGDALLHAAAHRRLHSVSPYEVDGRRHYGGDRLIWADDVDRLVRRLGEKGLQETMARAEPLGLGPALREALLLARDWLGTALPSAVLATPSQTPQTRAADYLAGGQVRRAWLDLREVEGAGAKARTLLTRIIPSRRFLEDRYGSGRPAGLPRLLLRRLRDFFSARPAGSRR